MTLPGGSPQPHDRGRVFRYDSWTADPETGTLTCRYSLDGREFAERITLPPGPPWHTDQAQAAARLVFLLAGVSYYKTAAPPVIDLGPTAVTEAELATLREFYLQGLGEFAFRNTLDLGSLRIEAPSTTPQATGPAPQPTSSAQQATSSAQQATDSAQQPAASPDRPLIPFGGGIDSIVTVEHVRPGRDAALFVVSRPSDRYAAIEEPAAVTGLPVIRAGREIDPQLLRSAELGFLNGHVPVTGILSAIAVLAATLTGRDAVVMSNEWSASIPTLRYQGRPVNHQYSKSAEFEAAFRGVLHDSSLLPGHESSQGTQYFSWLRDRTELWVAREFAALEPYHGSFRSCNKAFYADPGRRLDHWCGQCDKCSFIDLILAPFMPAEALRAIFTQTPEPLDNPVLAGRFRALLGAGAKPFECVGEVNECRAALLLAARRPDRARASLVQELAREVSSWPDAPTDDDAAAMLRPVGESCIPESYK